MGAAPSAGLRHEARRHPLGMTRCALGVGCGIVVWRYLAVENASLATRAPHGCSRGTNDRQICYTDQEFRPPVPTRRSPRRIAKRRIKKVRPLAETRAAYLSADARRTCRSWRLHLSVMAAPSAYESTGFCREPFFRMMTA